MQAVFLEVYTMKNFYFSCLTILFICASLLLNAQEVSAYKQILLANHENGAFAQDCQKVGKNPERIQIVSSQSIPEVFTNENERNAIGTYCLGFTSKFHAKNTDKPIASDYVNGISLGGTLYRSRIQREGRALFEADFYIPADPGKIPSLAILAMDPVLDASNSPKSFYRFGLTLNKRIYFSYITPENTLNPPFFSDIEMPKILRRPGWHRFSILFEGQETIRLFVDGIEPSFSPVKDKSLQSLQLGILLADPENDYTAYADNMTIYWSEKALPIPESPFSFTEVAQTPQSQDVQVEGFAWKSLQEGRDLFSQNPRPMVILFHSPGNPNSEKLIEIIKSTSQAQTYLSRFIPVLADVASPDVFSYAEKLKIFKTPTLLLMNYQGEPTRRVLFSPFDNWNTLQNKLSGRAQ